MIAPQVSRMRGLLLVGICLFWVSLAAALQEGPANKHLEVGVPERFLSPRDFNPHAYSLDDGRQYLEDVSPQDVGSLPHPYQFFERPPSRGETSSGAPIQFPKVPEAAQVQPPEPTAKLKPATIRHPLNIASNHLNEVPQDDYSLQNTLFRGYSPQYGGPFRVAYISRPVHRPVPAPRPLPVPQQVAAPEPEDISQELPVSRPILYKSKVLLDTSFNNKQRVNTVEGLAPKNYAFSYAVKDGRFGDDFSHSQAHSGAQTKGEYRVKLPDGRVQVVSYTADDNGYKADVRYDHAENSVEQAYEPPVVKYKPVYKPLLKTVYKPSYKSYYQYQPRPKEFTPIEEGPTEEPPVSPSQVFPGHPGAQQFFRSTAAPVALTYSVSTPRPFKKAFQAPQSVVSPVAYYVSSTSSPINYYGSSTSAPDYYGSSTVAPEHDSELVYPSSTVPPRYSPASPKHNFIFVQQQKR